ncbi:MAG: hypothetical protein J3R72DRAFT_421361 [Linnemannia gamsii]|nr:MAG: hypothetical protein J3R72DRAFT_421361 [Linnemannia gamsii]
MAWYCRVTILLVCLLLLLWLWLLLVLNLLVLTIPLHIEQLCARFHQNLILSLGLGLQVVDQVYEVLLLKLLTSIPQANGIWEGKVDVPSMCSQPRYKDSQKAGKRVGCFLEGPPASE